MTVTLQISDGKEQAALPLGLTINSALQYLTTLTKIAFVVPIIEGLNHLKWLWFASEPRPLLDFELYEDATRGGLVAMVKLLFRLRGVFRWYVYLRFWIVSCGLELMIRFHPLLGRCRGWPARCLSRPSSHRPSRSRWSVLKSNWCRQTNC